MLDAARSRLGAVRESVLNEVSGWWLMRREPRVTYHGVELDLSNPQFSNAIRGAIVRGHYEIGELRLIDDYLSADADLVELGGGIGFIAAYTHGRLVDGATHVVVEANKDLIPILEMTRLLNDADFSIERAAYAPGKDSTVFYRHRHFWSGSTASRSPDRTRVPATDLARLSDDYDIDAFSLIVDIEGAEVDLIAELPLLERSCCQLIIEFHDTKAEHRSVADEVAEAREALRASSMELVWSDSTKHVYDNPSLD